MKNLQLILALVLAVNTTLWAQDAKSTLTIEIFEAKLKQAGASAQILDARTPEEYKLNHLKGAINLSTANDTDLQQQIGKLDKKKPVFVYSIGNGRSGVLARKLKEQGFGEVYDLPGGFSHWIGSGRPVETTIGTGLTLEDYKKLLKSDKLVLVDIGSKYCGGCKKMLPVIDSLASENASTIKVVKIEFFENKELAQDLKIEAIPAFLLYDGQNLVWQKGGILPKSEIQKVIEEKAALAIKNH